ncbi:MAG: phosphate ABC transporter substrate-binding protein [Oscillospiraceae bacterium]
MLVFSLVSCSPTDKKGAETATKDDGVIMFNGSTTLAPVITSIATTFNEEFGTWNKFDASLPEKQIGIYVSAGGSGQGAKAVIEKTGNFGLLARTVKDSEKETITDYKEYLVGIDALTIAVNPENPILGIKDDFTKEEISKIFSGEYKTWKDFDASLPEEEIVVVTRDIGGGAHEVFQKAMMGETEVSQNAIQAPSMGALVTKIIENKWAIGYASYGVANQNAGKVSPVKVDGIEATAENIKNGSYVIQRPLLIIGSGEPTAIQKAFLDIVLGEEGQKVVDKMGFIRAN